MERNKGLKINQNITNESAEIHIHDQSISNTTTHIRMSRKEYLSTLKNNMIIDRFYNFNKNMNINDEKFSTLAMNTMMNSYKPETYDHSKHELFNSNKSFDQDTMRDKQRNSHDGFGKRKIRINTGLVSGNESIIFTNNDWSILLDTGRNENLITQSIPKTSEYISKPLTTSNKSRKHGIISFRIKNASRKTERVIDYTKRSGSKDTSSNL